MTWGVGVLRLSRAERPQVVDLIRCAERSGHTGLASFGGSSGLTRGAEYIPKIEDVPDPTTTSWWRTLSSIIRIRASTSFCYSTPVRMGLRRLLGFPKLLAVL